MSQDIWGAMDDWQQHASASHPASDEDERRTIAELLLARGEDRAAAIVAMSSYSSVQVDNWNGGQYEVSLSVPAAFFDRVDEPARAALAAAAEAVVGTAQFAGLDLSVKRSVAVPGWDAQLLTELSDRWREPDQASRPALPAGSGDASA